MNINRPVLAIITILVSVLIVTTVAIPVIENAQTDTEVIRQNSTTGYTLNENISDFTITAVKNSSSNFDYTINGKFIDKIDYSMMLFSPEVILQIQNSPSFWSKTFGGVSLSAADSFIIKSVNKNLTITSTVGESSTEKSMILTKSVFLADKNGDYIIRTATSSNPIYVNDNTSMYAMVYGGHWGNTMVSDKFTFKSAPATIGGWTNASSPVAVDPATFTLNSEVKDSCNIITKATIGESTATLIVPIDYTKTIPKDSTIISLLDVIPILLLLVPVFVAVAALKGRSD